MTYTTERTPTLEHVNREKISISEARKDLSKLVHSFESDPSKVFELDRRDNPSALLLSFPEYSPVINAYQSGDLKVLLATFIIKKWFASADIPAHLSKPQLKELETMEVPQLNILFQAQPSASIESLMEMGDLDEVLVTRLMKRSKIANAIAEAEKSKLYEVSEHLSSVE